MQPIIDYLQEMKDRGDEKAKHLLYKIKDPDAKTFIVVASFIESKTTSCYKLKDTWSSHEEIESARIRYNDYLKRDDLYSASICKVIVSTDYD
tara:strand:+ start:105 stop:383 length:279 start_codon:yes stop_codon:yes gene_type:complete